MFDLFFRETIEHRKALAREPLCVIEDGTKGCTSIDYYKNVIDMPIRPHWEVTDTKEKVESNEEKMFKQWLDNLYTTYGQQRLNHFEHNLNVRRQTRLDYFYFFYCALSSIGVASSQLHAACVSIFVAIRSGVNYGVYVSVVIYY